MLPRSLYAFVWTTSRKWQIRVVLLVAIVAPLSMAPLELQRRIIDHAIEGHDLWLLVGLAAIYLAVLLLQGGLKYLLNITQGRVLEEVTRNIRHRIIRHQSAPAGDRADGASSIDHGTVVSMLAAESEDVGGFASESLAVPLLQIGTMAWVGGYLVWVEPRIAAFAIILYAPQALLVPRLQRRINRLARRRTAFVRGLGRVAIALRGGTTGGRHGDAHAQVLVEQILRTRMHTYRLKYFLTFLGNFLDALGPLAVLGLGGYLVIQGHTTVSTLVVFISGFQKLSDPWDQLVTFYRSVSNARVTYNLIVEALRDGHPDAVAR